MQYLKFNKGNVMLPVVIGIAAVALLGVGLAYYAAQQLTTTSPSPVQVMEKESEAMMQKEAGEAMADKQSSASTNFQGQVLAGTASAPLLDFTQADYEAALKTNKLIVLYYFANWCPICAAETRDALYPAFNELTTDQVIGFQVNFNDNQTDNFEKSLASQHGVAYQHTKVFVKNGQRILKSPEEWNKQRYLTEINQALNQ